MHLPADEKMTVLARISGAKCLALGIPALALAIVPNLPGFGEGLIYHAYFYTTWIGVAVRLTASGVMLMIAISLLYGAVLNAIGSPQGVWLVDDEVRWGRIGTKRVALSAIKSAAFDLKRGGILLELQDGAKPMIIPTLGLRSQDAPESLTLKLRALMTTT